MSTLYRSKPDPENEGEVTWRTFFGRALYKWVPQAPGDHLGYLVNQITGKTVASDATLAQARRSLRLFGYEED